MVRNDDFSKNRDRRVYTLLIVDDDPDILPLLKAQMDKHTFRLIRAEDGEEAIDLIHSHQPDLVVLDINMPKVNGLEVCRNLRAAKDTQNLPIIFLSGRADEIDRVLGLEFGADDYVAKPFNVQELILRINNVLRRAYGTPPGDTLTFGVLVVDFVRHEVTVKNKPVSLTLTEFKLLSCLLDHLGQVKSRDYLLDQVWESGEGVFTRTVDTHIQRLRSKLNDAGKYIETVRGVGYRFHV